MRWQFWTNAAVVILASGALAWWQYHEYLHERELARETLHRQAHSVQNALIGGICGHRNRGRFFADQLQGSLSKLIQSEDILAVAVTSCDGELMRSAGETDLLDASPPLVEGDSWNPAGFRVVQRFELLPAAGGVLHGGGRGHGDRGLGRGLPSETLHYADAPFSAGGEFAAILVMDRSQTYARCRRAAWLRAAVVTAGVLLLFCVSWAWRVTVRAAGRTRLLEGEARHLHELSQAAAGLAHETRNPLGLIRGWTQRLAKARLPSAEQQEQAEAVVEECDRVTARINQFLAFARPCEPRRESVRIKDVLNELALILEPDLDAKKITLDYGGVAPDESVQADREMLRQVMFNLIQNAVHASPESQTVEVLVRRGQDGGRRIEVADHGPGVDAAATESLFTPYFTTRPNGTGLGLAIVRRIAGSHGWEVGYSPRSGGGAVFWLDRIHD
jgi:signal transduction histidine kinase